jgi:hypothetical protein
MDCVERAFSAVGYLAAGPLVGNQNKISRERYMNMADPVVYRSEVRVERLRGPLRRAYLPAEDKPIFFSVHSEIAEHYGVRPQDYGPHAATLDYLVAAAAG